MARIPVEQKLDNYRNMVGMVNDYERQYSRWPTNQEFVEKLGMTRSTASRYKQDILEQNKKALMNTFYFDMIIHVKKSLEAINKNVRLFENIREGSGDNHERMDAAKSVLESHLDAIRLIDEAPKYLGLDYDISKDEPENNIRRETTSERVEESIESTFNQINS